MKLDSQAQRERDVPRACLAAFMAYACMMQGCASRSVVAQTELTYAVAVRDACGASDVLSATLPRANETLPKNGEGLGPYRPKPDRRVTTFGFWK